MNEKLKLFVWDGVLEDWTTGMAFALAENATEAKKMLIEKGMPECHWDGIKLDGIKPSIRTSRCAFYSYGGG